MNFSEWLLAEANRKFVQIAKFGNENGRIVMYFNEFDPVTKQMNSATYKSSPIQKVTPAAMSPVEAGQKTVMIQTDSGSEYYASMQPEFANKLNISLQSTLPRQNQYDPDAAYGAKLGNQMQAQQDIAQKRVQGLA